MSNKRSQTPGNLGLNLKCIALIVACGGAVAHKL